MIANSFIVNLSRKWQSTELNVRQEYLQHLFLSYFYKNKESDKVLFKGGTALRIIYKSPRFSEDLDFSSTKATINNMENILINTAQEMEYEGISVDLEESKKTTGGYLAIINFVVHGQKIAVKIEVSRRKEKNIGEMTTVVNDFIPSYNLMVMTKDLLIKGKIDALMERHKARDFYDIYFILRACLLPVKEKKILKEVLILLDKHNILFDKELKNFLPKSHWGIIKNFKSSLKQEIRREM